MRKSLKRAAALVLTAAMMMGLCLTASAAQSVTITLDGQVITTEAYVDSNDRTQAPAAIAEALGMTVTADGAAATYAKDGVSVTFQGAQAGDTAMDTQTVEGYVPIAYLAPAFGYGIQWNGAAKTVALTSPLALTVDDIKSIQAYTDGTVYGTGVVEVVVTYADGVDLSDVTAASYILEDRGSLTPDFGQIAIADAAVEGQTVTLTIDNVSAATERNALIYTGENAGARERNALGIYCTGAWYRDVNGVLYYGAEDSGEYKANTINQGYQARESLELKLRHTGEDASAALSLVDANGRYTDANKWLPTVDRQFGEDGFQSVYDLQIPSTSANAEDGTGDAYVRGYYYVPDNYDPANGIVFTIQGQGISYWRLADGTDDDGTGIMYDTATTSWANKGAIVVNLHDRSSAGYGGSDYNFVLDDVNVMKYFIDKYEITGNIVLQGNSRGTFASSTILKALAGRPYDPSETNWNANPTLTLDKSVYDFEIDRYICQNGDLGTMQGKDTMWTDEDRAAIAATGLYVWVFDGQQDTNNIDAVAHMREIYQAAGMTAEEAAEHIRHTGYPSKLYAYWGESDHSTTRINGWYFSDAPYYGPDFEVVDGEIVYNSKLEPGDTYTLPEESMGSRAEAKTGYEYTVYGELYQEWALGK